MSSPEHPEYSVTDDDEKKRHDSALKYKKNLSEVTANAFRPGFSVRTFSGLTMFDHRDDNVGRAYRKLEYKLQQADGVDFQITININ